MKMHLSYFLSSYILITDTITPRRKFAFTCAACDKLIISEDGAETYRIIAMDKDFHVACYKCEVSVSLSLLVSVSLSLLVLLYFHFHIFPR
jgi:hypothetical protein